VEASGPQEDTHDQDGTYARHDQDGTYARHDQDGTYARHDQDGTYARHDQDGIYAPHEQDDTYEPYDFLPAAPQTEPVPSPTPWYDDTSYETRWAVLKEAATPQEESPEKPQPTD
jgi:hypothetical protein